MSEIKSFVAYDGDLVKYVSSVIDYKGAPKVVSTFSKTETEEELTERHEAMLKNPDLKDRIFQEMLERIQWKTELNEAKNK